MCNLFWGSHGCDLPEGHKGLHVCGSNDPEGPDSYHDGIGRAIMYNFYGGGWSDWLPCKCFR